MPTRLYEGPSVADILANIQKQYGESAQIVSARKIRKGGMVGFFSKEEYEVEISFEEVAAEPIIQETPTPIPAEQIKRVPPAPSPIDLRKTTSILDIAEQFNDVEKTTQQNISTSAPQTAGPVTAPTGPVVSPERPNFSAVLEAVREESRQSLAAAVQASTVQKPITEQPVAPTIIPAQVVAETPVAVETAIPTVEDSQKMQEMAQEVVAAAPQVEMNATQTVAQPAPVVAETPVAVETAIATQEETETVEEVVPKVETALPVVQEPQIEEATPAPARVTTLKRRRREDVPEFVNQNTRAKWLKHFTEIGMPKALIPVVNSESQLYSALEAQLRKLPKAETEITGTGNVTVIVGAKKLAYQSAADIAIECNESASDIILVSPNARSNKSAYADVIRDKARAAIERRGWRRRSQPTIVVVDVDSRISNQWVAEMLEALEPTSVWAVVDASQKIEDIERWTDAIGGVDALAVENTDNTMSPAAVLQLGIPVARLNGGNATTSRWTAILTAKDKQ